MYNKPPVMDACPELYDLFKFWTLMYVKWYNYTFQISHIDWPWQVQAFCVWLIASDRQEWSAHVHVLNSGARVLSWNR